MTLSVMARRPHAAVWLALVFLGLAHGVWLVLPAPLTMALMSERGPVEGLNAGLYVLGAVLIVAWRRPEDDWRLWTALVIVMLAFAAREMDWHRAFTGTSVLKFSFFLRDGQPVHRVVAALVLAPVAWACAHLCLQQGPRVLRGLRRRDPVAVTVLIFALTLVVAKTADHAPAILAESWGIVLSPSVRAWQTSVEEVMELALAFLVALGAWQHRSRTG
ncbi:hypothetical protein [Caldimonas sp.]|uniref:hypothetical protein n=1 Tax=Caldimonas sp. TaxID=2838790 RepID=UPI00307FBED7